MGMLDDAVLMVQSPTEEIGDFGEATKRGSIRILQEPLGKEKVA